MSNLVIEHKLFWILLLTFYLQSLMSEHNPAHLQEIIDTQRKVFDRLDERDVALFIAHTEHDKSVQQLAEQTGGRTAESIQKTIDYIRLQLADELEV